mmetsp:Transcript_76943/g.170423  ORF Transcript_76943/g.170423 Transcript_76943/m.170423 type:complete len:338 (-) Transcript_76943:340-1353(-)
MLHQKWQQPRSPTCSLSRTASGKCRRRCRQCRGCRRCQWRLYCRRRFGPCPRTPRRLARRVDRGPRAGRWRMPALGSHQARRHGGLRRRCRRCQRCRWKAGPCPRVLRRSARSFRTRGLASPTTPLLRTVLSQQPCPRQPHHVHHPYRPHHPHDPHRHPHHAHHPHHLHHPHDPHRHPHHPRRPHDPHHPHFAPHVHQPIRIPKFPWRVGRRHPWHQARRVAGFYRRCQRCLLHRRRMGPRPCVPCRLANRVDAGPRVGSLGGRAASIHQARIAGGPYRRCRWCRQSHRCHWCQWKAGPCPRVPRRLTGRVDRVPRIGRPRRWAASGHQARRAGGLH